MVAEPSPTMEQQRPLAFALLIGEVNVIQPPGGIHACRLGVCFLLPVEPPEIDAALLQRMVHNVHVVDGELLVAIGPIPRPPRAKSKSRRQRNPAGNFGEIAQRLLVVMAVAEEIPILPVTRGALHHPRPGTLLAMSKAEVCRCEQWTRRV